MLAEKGNFLRPQDAWNACVAEASKGGKCPTKLELAAEPAPEVFAWAAGGGECSLCHEPAGEGWEVDHVTPLSRQAASQPTELALACDFRIATDHPRPQIGLPEVKLGVIPGFGGTQSLPRLIGVRPALNMILKGSSVDARKAARLGLVDTVVPDTLLREHVLRFAHDVLAKGGKS